MQMRLRTGFVLSATLAIGLLIAGTAAGDTDIRVVSTVTLAKPNPFHGHVSARRHTCEVNRVVRVVKVKPQRNELIDRTRTNRNGRWSIPVSEPKGDFRAKVKRQRKEHAGGGLTIACTADRSAIRHFDKA